MGGCGCGAKKTVQTLPQSLMSSSGNFGNFLSDENMLDGELPQMVTVEYFGPRKESFTIRSVAMPGKLYRFANNDTNSMQVMFLKDAERVLGMMTPPEYRVVGAGAGAEVRDPTVFLGQPIG